MDLNIYQNLYKGKLSKEELLEVESNLVGFLELLIEIDRELKNNDRHNSTNNSER